jgi:hypothetical protein
MYIIYNNIKYPCTCRPSNAMVYRGLPDDFPAPVDGEISLCADDGFTLRKDNATDYLRQTFEDGVLVLTNEPEPIIEPEPTIDERVTDLEDAVV